MAYGDVYVMAVPTANLAAYKTMAKTMAKVFMAHGALSYSEWIEDDVPEGKTTSFGKAVKRKEGEVIAVGFATYKSKAERNKIMKAVMSDARLNFDPKAMPFDGKRMFWGGFKPVVSK